MQIESEPKTRPNFESNQWKLIGINSRNFTKKYGGGNGDTHGINGSHGLILVNIGKIPSFNLRCFAKN